MLQYINNISIIFISIILEAFPMILLGIIISAFVNEFISDEKMAKLIPKNPILGSIAGVIIGIFIPTCDCAVIPITKRLIKKGVPLNVAITFMLSSPIVNPVVIFSTIYAFSSSDYKIIIYRPLFGIIIAIVIGMIMSVITKKNDVIRETDEEDDDGDCCHSHYGHDHDLHNDDEEYEQIHKKHRHGYKEESNGFFKHSKNILTYCKEEFWEVSKYLIFGAFIASLIQVLIPKNYLYIVANNRILSVIVLMLFAYFISLCSTSDSFVAKTFVKTFSSSSILAFLLLGPMIDIKNTFMLFGNYKKKFVFKLIFLIFIFVFLICTFIKI